VAKLVYYTLVLFVLQFAFGVFGPNPISDLISSVLAFLPGLTIVIVIVVVAAAIAAAVKSLIEGTLGGLSYGKVLANIAAVFILGLGIITALEQVGVATAITTPVLVAVLATIGGGLIKPMQHRWEGYLVKAEEEAPKIKAEAGSAPSVSIQAQMAKTRAQAEVEPAPYGATPALSTTARASAADQPRAPHQARERRATRRSRAWLVITAHPTPDPQGDLDEQRRQRPSRPPGAHHPRRRLRPGRACGGGVHRGPRS